MLLHIGQNESSYSATPGHFMLQCTAEKTPRNATKKTPVRVIIFAVFQSLQTKKYGQNGEVKPATDHFTLRDHLIVREDTPCFQSFNK